MQLTAPHPAAIVVDALAALHRDLDQTRAERDAARRDLLDAQTDDVTGVWTRRAWMDRAHQRVRTHRSPTLLVCVLADLDGLKPINSAHGHAVGDRALAEIGHRLTGIGREVLAGRLGGDEFATLVTVPAGTSLPYLAGEIAAEVRGSLIVPGRDRPLPVTASVGTALVDTTGPPRSALSRALRAADEAMYQAKNRKEGAE